MSTIFNTKAWAFSFAGQGGEENIRNALTTAKSWTAMQVGRVLRSRKFQCTNTPNALTQTLPFEVIIPIIIMIDPTVAMVAALRLVCKGFKAISRQVCVYALSFLPRVICSSSR